MGLEVRLFEAKQESCWLAAWWLVVQEGLVARRATSLIVHPHFSWPVRAPSTRESSNT